MAKYRCRRLTYLCWAKAGNLTKTAVALSTVCLAPLVSLNPSKITSSTGTPFSNSLKLSLWSTEASLLVYRNSKIAMLWCKNRYNGLNLKMSILHLLICFACARVSRNQGVAFLDRTSTFVKQLNLSRIELHFWSQIAMAWWF